MMSCQNITVFLQGISHVARFIHVHEINCLSFLEVIKVTKNTVGERNHENNYVIIYLILEIKTSYRDD